MLENLEDGSLAHCKKNVTWKDCPSHVECYYFECEVCNYKSLTDCQETE